MSLTTSFSTVSIADPEQVNISWKLFYLEDILLRADKAVFSLRFVYLNF